jgi:hypothetical protein
MRVLARVRRWLRDLRAFWRANLRVASAWRQDRRRLVRYALLTWLVDGIALAVAGTDAFLLYPAAFAEPVEPIVGAPAVHGVLVGWLEALGLRGAPRTGEGDPRVG